MEYVSYWIELNENINEDAHLMITFHKDPVEKEFVFMPRPYKSFFMDTIENASIIHNRFRDNGINLVNTQTDISDYTFITDKAYPIQLLSDAIDPSHSITFNFDGDCGFPVTKETLEEYSLHDYKAKCYW